MMVKCTSSQTNTLSCIFYSARSLKQQSVDKHVAPLGHIILIPRLGSFSLMLCAQRRRNKYKFYSLWIDPIGARTHDMLHSRQARQLFLVVTVMYKTKCTTNNISYVIKNKKCTSMTYIVDCAYIQSLITLLRVPKI